MIVMMLARYMARDLAPYIDRSKCLSYVSNEACKECMRSCPADAINIANNVEIDERKCRGCGACIAACPGRCLQAPEGDWPRKIKQIFSTGCAEFGCPASKNRAINTVVHCLGGIPAEFFASVDQITEEVLTLDLGPCRRCKNRKAIKQLKPSLRQASKLTGRPIRYKIINSFRKGLPEFTKNESNQVTIRSGELVRLKTIWTNMAGKFFSAQKNNSNLDFTDETAKGCSKLSPLRTVLVVAANFKESVSFSLPSWQINDSCTGCNHCVGSCLQRAWDFIFKDNRANLIHYPLRCTACGRCSAICPQEALEYAPASWPQSGGDSYIKRVFVTKRCDSCQSLFIIRENGDKLCRPCISREKLRSSIQASIM